MLLYARRHHPAALRASMFAVYGVDIDDPGMGLLKLADLVAYLPRGCALWQDIGGRMAWSPETEALYAVRDGIAILAWQKTKDGHKNSNQPKPTEPPIGWREAEERQRRAERRMERHAQARRERAERRRRRLEAQQENR